MAIDLMAHEAPLESTPSFTPVHAIACHFNTQRPEESVATPVKKVSTEPVVVPLVLPQTRHGLRSLTAAQIRAILQERNLPCSSNKMDNIVALMAHIEKAKRGPSPAPSPAPHDALNPFLNGYRFPLRDESPVLTRVLSLETVATSVHEGLGVCALAARPDDPNRIDILIAF